MKHCDYAPGLHSLCSSSSYRQWSELVDTALSVVNPPSVFEQTLNKLILTNSNSDVPSSSSLHLDLPADDESFDWSRTSRETSPPLVSPSYFRPEKPESPVDINFDHSRAALGEWERGEGV